MQREKPKPRAPGEATKMSLNEQLTVLLFGLPNLESKHFFGTPLIMECKEKKIMGGHHLVSEKNTNSNTYE